jgi:carbon storage regulator
MLVLTRRLDESIVIDDHIVVTILAIEGDKVKIGITAPREVTILRQELHQAVLEQNMIASQLVIGPESSTFQELRKLLAEEASKAEENVDPEPKSKGREEPADPSEE